MAIFTTGAAGHLHDRLRQPFAGSKVRAEQPVVGVDDADQRQLWKMMPFRQHLGADQYVRGALLRQRKRRIYCTLLLRAVAVDALDALLWQTFAQSIFEPLRPFSERFDFGATGRA